MRSFKKATTLAAVVTVFAATAALAGCSNTSTGSSDSDGAAPKGAVAMGYAGADVTIWNNTLDVMRPIIEDAGYELLTDDPQWDVQKQVSDWSAWIQRGDVKAIMGFPVQPDAVVPVTQQALQAGIPVVGYAIKWDGVDYGMMLDDFADGKRIGVLVGEWVNENASSTKEVPVAVVTERTSQLGINRSDGMVEGLKETAPNVKIYDLPAISRAEANSVAKSQLVAEPDTKIWLGVSSDQISGAYQALLDSGVAEDEAGYLVANMDATNETLDGFQVPNSIWSIQTALSATDLGEANAKLLLQAAEGTAKEDIVLSSTQITPENIDLFYTK